MPEQVGVCTLRGSDFSWDELQDAMETMKQSIFSGHYAGSGKFLGCCLMTGFLILGFFSGLNHAEEKQRSGDDALFVLDNSIDLRDIADGRAGSLLSGRKGIGVKFGQQQVERYCSLKKHPEKIQWVLNDLQTGEIISRSPNADQLYFGASVSKLFVAAALLDKQKGDFDKDQLNQVVRMIVVSDNRAWKELQRQTGDEGTDDSGREAVDKFIQRMGYSNIKGFQGWMKKKDGTRVHGNELNTLELSDFLYDTYQGNYEGADVLWKIMHATATGKSKIDKYTPSHIHIGGKTGTYDGPNASPDTIDHANIRARNHAAVLRIDDRYYGISILSNTGRNEDVAVLGGGLIREYLGVDGMAGEKWCSSD